MGRWSESGLWAMFWEDGSQLDRRGLKAGFRGRPAGGCDRPDGGDPWGSAPTGLESRESYQGLSQRISPLVPQLWTQGCAKEEVMSGI